MPSKIAYTVLLTGAGLGFFTSQQENESHPDVYTLWYMLIGTISLPLMLFFFCGIDIERDIYPWTPDEEEENARDFRPAEEKPLALLPVKITLRQRLKNINFPDEQIPYEMKDPVHDEFMNEPLVLNTSHTIDRETYEKLSVPKTCPKSKQRITSAVINLNLLNLMRAFVEKKERKHHEAVERLNHRWNLSRLFHRDNKNLPEGRNFTTRALNLFRRR